MKSFVFGLIVLATQVSSANLQNSTYDARHQSEIRTAIENTCGLYGGYISQTSSMEFPDHVDQGIHDVNYITEFNIKVAIDQYNFDEYNVEVYSKYSDHYDHNSKNWGAYSVSNVNCHK